jgi:hypothetical protein
MNQDLMFPTPVRGKTFSLFGTTDSTDPYFRQISHLVDELMESYGSPQQLLLEVRKANRFWSGRFSGNDSMAKRLGKSLAPYTVETKRHLASLSLFKRFDRVLSTSEKQYHLYMLEIELTNRIYLLAFRKAEMKLAFLPHCLRDLTRNCRAAKDGIDVRCKACSRNCYLNHASRLLKTNGVEAYIWMDADLRRLFRKLKSVGKRPGVLGIACIPELVKGMRLCIRHNLPVVGLPLNANRCARWMGQFHPNSINLQQLEKLLK